MGKTGARATIPAKALTIFREPGSVLFFHGALAILVSSFAFVL